MPKIETFESVIEEMICSEAENMLGRELTKDEYEDMYERVFGNLAEFIHDKVSEMEEEHELIGRNKGAEKRAKYYKILSKNENAYRKEFEVEFTAKTLEDAREYVHRPDNIITEYDQYKIVAVDGKAETEVETIGRGLPIN